MLFSRLELEDAKANRVLKEFHDQEE